MRCALAGLAGAAIPFDASAHVKWFCSTVDVTRAPATLASVVTPAFVVCLAAFVLMVFAGFLADGWLARRWPKLATTGGLLDGAEENLIRVATGAYFLCLWDKGEMSIVATGDVILTPETVSSVGWVGLLQFAVAASVVSRRTCILAALGIGALFLQGIAQYGVFHMIDYLFFPGIAFYLAATSTRWLGALVTRVPVLVGSLAFSLAWTAIEKFVYPQWTAVILFDHPQLAMGLDWDVFVVFAAFVEFSLAFYLATGRGLLRFGALGFMALFLLAIPEFGHTDAVGHMPVVAILGVACLRGASPLQDALTLVRRGIAMRAASVSLLYMGALTAFFASYYGVQWMEYGGR